MFIFYMMMFVYPASLALFGVNFYYCKNWINKTAVFAPKFEKLWNACIHLWDANLMCTHLIPWTIQSGIRDDQEGKQTHHITCQFSLGNKRIPIRRFNIIVLWQIGRGIKCTHSLWGFCFELFLHINLCIFTGCFLPPWYQIFANFDCIILIHILKNNWRV